MVLRWPKMAPRWSKMLQRRPQDTNRWPQAPDYTCSNWNTLYSSSLRRATRESKPCCMSSLEMSSICRDPGMFFVTEAKQADVGNTIPSLPTSAPPYKSQFFGDVEDSATPPLNATAASLCFDIIGGLFIKHR